MSFNSSIGSKVLGLQQQIDDAELFLCHDEKKFELRIEILNPNEKDIENFNNPRSFGILKAKPPFLIWKFQYYPIVTTCRVYDEIDMIFFNEPIKKIGFNKLIIFMHDKFGWVKTQNEVYMDRSFIDYLQSRSAKPCGNAETTYQNFRKTRTSLSIEEIWRRAEKFEF